MLVDGLTSYFFGSEIVGPADVVAGDDGTIYVSIGGPGPQTALFDPAGNADSVVKVDSSGTVDFLGQSGSSSPDTSFARTRPSGFDSKGTRRDISGRRG